MKIKVKCVGCGATRYVDDEESAKLSRNKDVPMCSACYMPMVAVSARGVTGTKKRKKQ